MGKFTQCSDSFWVFLEKILGEEFKNECIKRCDVLERKYINCVLGEWIEMENCFGGNVFWQSFFLPQLIWIFFLVKYKYFNQIFKEVIE